ncbi:MAG TPA: PIG-L deacetylase family protein [Anaerolineae bacterium]|nr:PIG-L deacetylase family protein [Anaerolineae bacterium]
MSDNKNGQTELSDSAIPERAINKVDSTQEPKAPKRVLSINAHPDDQEFTVGGTLAKWARAGTEIITVVITSGDAGSNERTDATMTKTKLAELREEEQRRACAVLGVRETVFLHYSDGTLQPTLDLRRDLTRLVRKFKPDAVMCGDPTARFFGNSYMNHPDHRAAGDAACDAVFPSAGTRFIFPELLAEGYEPHEVSRVFLHGSEKSDVWIDISETLETKVKALREHVSQIGDWDPMERMQEWARDEGKERGIDCAESFRVMILKEEKVSEEEEREAKHEFVEAEL